MQLAIETFHFFFEVAHRQRCSIKETRPQNISWGLQINLNRLKFVAWDPGPTGITAPRVLLFDLLVRQLPPWLVLSLLHQAILLIWCPSQGYLSHSILLPVSKPSQANLPATLLVSSWPSSARCLDNIEEYWWILEMACNIDEYWHILNLKSTVRNIEKYWVILVILSNIHTEYHQWNFDSIIEQCWKCNVV